MNKQQVKDIINENRVTEIRFTKKDGTERVLKVLRSELIPAVESDEAPKKESTPEPEHLIRVYDVNDGWRSVIIDSIIEVKSND